jgi:hypothetical protein
MKDTRLLNAKISSELHKQLRFRAVEEDTTIRTIVERALWNYLDSGSSGAADECAEQPRDHAAGLAQNMNDAFDFAKLAIRHLDRLKTSDPNWSQALKMMKQWVLDQE